MLLFQFSSISVYIEPWIHEVVSRHLKLIRAQPKTFSHLAVEQLVQTVVFGRFVNQLICEILWFFFVHNSFETRIEF